MIICLFTGKPCIVAIKLVIVRWFMLGYSTVMPTVQLRIRLLKSGFLFIKRSVWLFKPRSCTENKACRNYFLKFCNSLE